MDRYARSATYSGRVWTAERLQVLRERSSVGRSSGNLRRIIVCFVPRMIRSFPTTPISGSQNFKDYVAFTIKMFKTFDLSSSRCGSETRTHVVEERIGAGFGAAALTG